MRKLFLSTAVALLAMPFGLMADTIGVGAAVPGIHHASHVIGGMSGSGASHLLGVPIAPEPGTLALLALGLLGLGVLYSVCKRFYASSR